MNENRATVQASDGGQVNLQLSPASLAEVSPGRGRIIGQRLQQTKTHFSLLRLQTWILT